MKCKFQPFDSARPAHIVLSLIWEPRKILLPVLSDAMIYSRLVLK